MKTKLLITTTFLILLTSVSAAEVVVPTPGGGGGVESTEVTIPAEVSLKSFPVDGEVPVSAITDDCDLETLGNSDAQLATVEQGETIVSQNINGMRGYLIDGAGSQSCTATIESSDITGELNTGFGGNAWTLFSVPRESTWGDMEISDSCSLSPYEGSAVWSVSMTEGVEALDVSSDLTFSPTEAYWIKGEGDCNLDPGDGLNIPSPEDGDDSGDDDSSDSEETTAEAGDLYFWDTESSSSLVNNEAGSPDDSATLSYDMYDNTINGRFTSHGSGERTIIVEGPRGEASNTGSGNYVSYPAEGSDSWGTEEDGVNEMLGSYTDSTFTVTVEDAGTGEQIQQEEFSFDPSGQARDITTDLENRNTDHVTISGSSLEFDGSGSNNAYATWKKAMGDDKTVEINFEINDPGHTRLEICGESCGDGDNGNIHAAYFFYGDNNVRVDEPYDGGNAYNDELIGQYEANSEYTFRIVEEGATVTMELEGPGIDHSTEVEEAYTFEQYSVDTEAGTNDNWPGIDLTVNEVTAQDN